jgi:double-stranded uracil-DNA glycosylase
MTVGFTSYSEACSKPSVSFQPPHESVSASTVWCQINQNINQFWALLSAILAENLVRPPYSKRLERPQAHGIGLWDAIAACEREGSLDASIRNAQSNDFAKLKHRCPHLARVCFNGKTSGKLAARFADAGFETVALPSSSPANAQLSFAQKLALWQSIKG